MEGSDLSDALSNLDRHVIVVVSVPEQMHRACKKCGPLREWFQTSAYRSVRAPVSDTRKHPVAFVWFRQDSPSIQSVADRLNLHGRRPPLVVLASPTAGGEVQAVSFDSDPSRAEHNRAVHARMQLARPSPADAAAAAARDPAQALWTARRRRRSRFAELSNGLEGYGADDGDLAPPQLTAFLQRHTGWSSAQGPTPVPPVQYATVVMTIVALIFAAAAVVLRFWILPLDPPSDVAAAAAAAQTRRVARAGDDSGEYDQPPTSLFWAVVVVAVVVACAMLLGGWQYVKHNHLPEYESKGGKIERVYPSTRAMYGGELRIVATLLCLIALGAGAGPTVFRLRGVSLPVRCGVAAACGGLVLLGLMSFAKLLAIKSPNYHSGGWIFNLAAQSKLANLML